MNVAEMALALDGLHDEMVATRRDLHRHPELGFQEVRTAGIVVDRLTRSGLRVRSGVAETGVLALVQGGLPGPAVLVRADFDALPVQERNDLPFRSQVDGRMHACGHDGHTAIGLAVAQVLHQHRATLPGAVQFAFQPAEEMISGAKPMIEQGALDDPPIDATLSFHLTTELPVGQVAVRSGPLMASADRFELLVRGSGGHGAYPHRSVDAITIACEIVAALQTLVAREVAAVDAAVISFGTFQAGTAFNILPPEARLSGTLRALEPALRSRLTARIGEVSRGIATAMRAEAEVTFHAGCPPVVNDPGITELVRGASRNVVGAEATVEGVQHMGADDASYFLEARPGCYFFVGAADPARGFGGPHHSPEFRIDEASLPIAAQVLLRSIVNVLQGSQTNDGGRA